MIILLSGKKRSGKDTVAEMLQEYDEFIKVSFAYPIKKGISEFFGWSLDKIENQKEVVDPIYGISPRQILQFLGTEVFQYKVKEAYPDFIGQKVWAQRASIEIREQYYNNRKNFIVTDNRFLHEVEAMCSLGKSLDIPCINIRITRDLPNQDTHASETSINDFDSYIDYEIENNSSLEELRDKVKQIYHEIKGA